MRDQKRRRFFPKGRAVGLTRIAIATCLAIAARNVQAQQQPARPSPRAVQEARRIIHDVVSDMRREHPVIAVAGTAISVTGWSNCPPGPADAPLLAPETDARLLRLGYRSFSCTPVDAGAAPTLYPIPFARPPAGTQAANHATPGNQSSVQPPVPTHANAAAQNLPTPLGRAIDAAAFQRLASVATDAPDDFAQIIASFYDSCGHANEFEQHRCEQSRQTSQQNALSTLWRASIPAGAVGLNNQPIVDIGRYDFQTHRFPVGVSCIRMSAEVPVSQTVWMSTVALQDTFCPAQTVAEFDVSIPDANQAESWMRRNVRADEGVVSDDVRVVVLFRIGAAWVDQRHPGVRGRLMNVVALQVVNEANHEVLGSVANEESRSTATGAASVSP